MAKVLTSFQTVLIGVTYSSKMPSRGDGPPALCFFADSHVYFFITLSTLTKVITAVDYPAFSYAFEPSGARSARYQRQLSTTRKEGKPPI